MLTTQLNLALISAVEADLIAVITSEESSLKEKSDACRELGPIGSKAAVEPLVALLKDERISHMARYGLEPNPDPSVDEALRKALRPSYPEVDGISLIDYKVRIVDGHAATAAKTRVQIVHTDGKRTWGTVGVSDSIIEASWIALADGIDFFLQHRREARAQTA